MIDELRLKFESDEDVLSYIISHQPTVSVKNRRTYPGLSFTLESADPQAANAKALLYHGDETQHHFESP